MTKQKLLKRAANERHNAKYGRRKKKDRKKARRELILSREERWLRDSGIPRDKTFPLA